MGCHFHLIKSIIKENTTGKAKGKHVTNGTICIVFKLQKLDLVKGQTTFVFSFTTHFFLNFILFYFFYFLNFKIFNSYMSSQT